eukprot:14835-Heterococcus_DN1.PRE.1
MLHSTYCRSLQLCGHTLLMRFSSSGIQAALQPQHSCDSVYAACLVMLASMGLATPFCCSAVLLVAMSSRV